MSIERRPGQPDKGQQPFGGGQNEPQRDEQPIHGPPQQARSIDGVGEDRSQAGLQRRADPEGAPEPRGTETDPARNLDAPSEDERLKEHLLDRVRAAEEGRIELSLGTLTYHEISVLNQIMHERYHVRITTQRIERNRLKSLLGKREFKKRRRRGEFGDLYS